RCGPGNHPRGVRRSAARGHGPRVASCPGNPGRRKAADDDPRVSGRASVRTRRPVRAAGMIAAARIAAYDILCAVSAGHADLPTAIAFARDSLNDDRDRALAAEIAAGVERWRGALDHVIAAFARRSLDRLDPEVVEILRLSAYQL